MTPGRDVADLLGNLLHRLATRLDVLANTLDGIAGSQGEYRDKGEYPIQSLHDCVLASNKFMTSRAMP
jgi:hypothetical protein